MTRDHVALGEPEDPAKLATDFPCVDPFPLDQWFRAHSDAYAGQPDRGCWWFASRVPPDDGDGRFDLDTPLGTCYFADDVEAAVRERLGEAWGNTPYLPAGALVGTTVSQVDLTPYVEPPDIADTDNKDAAGFVTRELASGASYELTQRHAMAFALAGFRALYYRPRFTPGDVRALALFGDAGRPAPARPAIAYPDWMAHLKSTVRSSVTKRRATIVP